MRLGVNLIHLHVWILHNIQSGQMHEGDKAKQQVICRLGAFLSTKMLKSFRKKKI